MNVPVPNNRLVAFTLTGALLTTIVAGGLAFPGLGLASPGDTISMGPGTIGGDTQQAVSNAPTPNQRFTPAVQTRSGYGDGEHEEEGDSEEKGEHEAEDEYEEGGEEEEAEHGVENGNDEDGEESEASRE
jgi:hypothetical protein